jgi:predicted secreted hydrolase
VSAINTLRRAFALALGGMATAPLCVLGAATGLQQRRLQFPRDFGSHNDLRTEWWYATGSLQAARGGGASFGFQLTFFRSRNDAVSVDHPSRFAARHLLFAHAALTDLQAGRLRHDQRIARWSGRDADSAAAFASSSDTHVALQGWRLQRNGGAGASRYLAVLDARRHAGFALDLQLAATQPLILHGNAGLFRRGETGAASHYYSEPQLAVTGRLMRDGGPALDVTGRAWLDHECGDTFLPPDAVGWDWIGMNLHDGSALMATRIRRADGSTVWSAASWRAASAAQARSFEGDDVQFTPGPRHWTSPATQARYPVEWTLQTPVGRYLVKSRLDAQELDNRNSTGTVYWEGLSDLVDAGTGRVVGSGYLEMTGYAGALRI